MTILAALAGMAGCYRESAPMGRLSYQAPGAVADFEQREVGTLPPGWTVESTNMPAQQATWLVTQEPDGNKAMSLTSPNHNERPTYNILVNETSDFQNGRLTVRLRANSGVIDQGGGLVWRYVDANNYYIARYNPLETNLRLYHVKDGQRTMLSDAPEIAIPAGQWVSLQVDHFGSQIRVALDGTERISVTDATFPGPGRIGLWTKADAATSFDDLVCSTCTLRQ